MAFVKRADIAKENVRVLTSEEAEEERKNTPDVADTVTSKTPTK